MAELFKKVHVRFGCDQGDRDLCVSVKKGDERAGGDAQEVWEWMCEGGVLPSVCFSLSSIGYVQARSTSSKRRRSTRTSRRASS